MESLLNKIDDDIIATKSEVYDSWLGINGITDTGGGIGGMTPGTGGGPRAKSSVKPVRASGLKPGCCSTPCSRLWNLGQITSLAQLGSCVKNKCNLK